MGPFVDGWKEEDVEIVLLRGDPNELLYIPIIVGMNAADCDREWAEAMCYALVDHNDPTVRGNAVLGLGHVARNCRELDFKRAIPIIANSLSDLHEFVRGQANSAAFELHFHLGILVPGYDTQNTQAFFDTVEELRRRDGF